MKPEPHRRRVRPAVRPPAPPASETLASGRRRAVLAAWVLLALAFPACNTDPVEAVRSERLRWNVQLLSWTQQADGRLRMTVRASGPARSPLETLTVRVLLFDDADQVLERRFLTLDLSEIEGGGPEDLTVFLDPPAGESEVVSVGLDPLPAPGPEEMAHMPEFQAVVPEK